MEIEGEERVENGKGRDGRGREGFTASVN